MEREIVIGRMYKHFKGNLYTVTGIATHTETGEKLVIYRRADGTGDIWARPYAMFNSEVDHKKYPDVKQKYRFEEYKPAAKKPAGPTNKPKPTKKRYPKKTLGGGLG